MVLRNRKGIVLDGFARSVKACSSPSGELLAIRAACEVVLRLSLIGVEVESDNKQPISLSSGFMGGGARYSTFCRSRSYLFS